MPRNLIETALEVKSGKTKLTALPEGTRKRVEWVLASGSLRHMSGPVSPAQASFKVFQGAPDRTKTRR